MAEKQVGKVIHWYDRIGVAVVRLQESLKSGDNIKIRRGDAEFETTVTSMQIEHKEVSVGEKGDEVAIKLPQSTKEGAVVFLVE